MAAATRDHQWKAEATPNLPTVFMYTSLDSILGRFSTSSGITLIRPEMDMF